ncbi:UNVERIFIED_CONTAM: hypothetical protein H355_000289 [Colinus virginianus]|nr:hypothetical protein H355_000289 [Colinus virginianus]
MAPVLNLNNEVVKMRKDVKKARVLTIRRLTRHIGKLKLKKGSEELKLKNQKRVERLIEEIHAMKPKSTAQERAIARLATHPLLKTKIAELKAAVKAFKDARKNPAKASPSEKKLEAQPKLAQNANSNLNEQVLKLVQKQQGSEDKTKMSVKMETVRGADKLSEREPEQETMEMERIPKDFLTQTIETKAVTQPVKKLGCKKRKENVSTNKLTTMKQVIRDDSDLEQHSEEEYFDDSTEERFYNQTSNSDSDSNDDFFIGKVKRKKKTAAVNDLPSVKEKDTLQKNILKEEKSTVSGTVQNLMVEEKPHAKARKLESVFCTSLATANHKSQTRRHMKDQPLKNRQTALLKKEPQFKKQSFGKTSLLKCDSKNPRLEQPLHPSWEASRRRREQMSQITAFQGKKIKFDD